MAAGEPRLAVPPPRAEAWQGCALVGPCVCKYVLCVQVYLCVCEGMRYVSRSWVYVSADVSMCVCMCACMCRCVHIWLRRNVSVCVHTYARTHLCVQVCLSACLCGCLSAHICLPGLRDR